MTAAAACLLALPAFAASALPTADPAHPEIAPPQVAAPVPPEPSPAVAAELATEPAAPPTREAGPSSAVAIKNVDLFEKSLGASHQAVHFYGRYDNDAELARINRIGYAVAAQSGFSDMPFTFQLIDMPEPNALALPGGQIFVTRGMLDLGLDDDMLACLLGHEIQHVVGQHGVKMQRRATVVNLLAQLALIGAIAATDGGNRDNPAPVYDYYGRERYDTGGDIVSGTYAAGMILGELLLRSYNREFEDESDEEGQRYAAAAGYDPHGTAGMMQLMRERIPESREYGYWRTHPFYADRVNAAAARAAYITKQPPRAVTSFRQATQAVLLDWVATSAKAKPKPPATGRDRDRRGEPDERRRPAGSPDEPGTMGFDRREPPETLANFVESQAMAAWPSGPEADRLRLAAVHGLRDRELVRPDPARDYGRVLARYDHEIAILSELDPTSPALPTLASERAGLLAQRETAYPAAVQILTSGVFETGFLETFLSNYPDAPEAAKTSLRLGEAYSRLNRQTEAVEQFLSAWDHAPESPEGIAARDGLRNSAPYLDKLAALEELANQTRDPELAALAEGRLTKMASTYTDIADGAEYLDRFAAGRQAAAVEARREVLAQQLYGEIVLYQSVGDHVKALERIQKLFVHAPLSAAATRLRERMLEQVQS